MIIQIFNKTLFEYIFTIKIKTQTQHTIKHLNFITILLTLLFGSTMNGLWAQDQHATGLPLNIPNLIELDSLTITPEYNVYDTACVDRQYFVRLVNSQDPNWGMPYSSAYDTSNYFSLNRGGGQKHFMVKMTYWNWQSGAVPSYQVWVDGQYSPNDTVTLIQHIPIDSVTPSLRRFTDVLRVSYHEGDLNDSLVASREFALHHVGSPNFDIRFHAAMLGVNVEEPRGHFDTPELPEFILRDPPGDHSYSTYTSDSSVCLMNGLSVSNTEASSGWGKVRLGVSGSIGFLGFASLSFGAGIDFGVSIDREKSRNDESEVQTCLSITTQYTTPQFGSPQDIYVCTSKRFVYGEGYVHTRDCDGIMRTPQLVAIPEEILVSHLYTGQQIDLLITGLQDTIPILETAMANGTITDSTLLKLKMNQLDAWQQTLALNDNIVADQSNVNTIGFNSGGSGITQIVTQAVSERKSITYKATMSNGFSSSFYFDMAGSGLSLGGDLTFRKEIGASEGSTVNVTNSSSYHLQDNGTDDQFEVKVSRDRVQGSFAFILDSANSKTSCPYEGGYQLDQPSLFVGSLGNSELNVNNVPVGGSALFPLFICNNSNVQRSYALGFINESNTEGGKLSIFGNSLNSTDNGAIVSVPPDSCLDIANLTLSQQDNALDILNFDSIQVVLFTPCEPGIAASILISAHFDPTTGITTTSPSNSFITVRPNPSAGRFELVATELGHNTITVTVHDGLGRVVLPKVSFTGQRIIPINLVGISPGVYYLTATMSNQRQVLRVIVE